MRPPLVALPAFSVRRSARAKRPRLTVTAEGEAVVVLPLPAPDRAARVIVAQHRTWLERHLERVRTRSLRLAARPALGAGRRLSIAGETSCVELVAVGSPGDVGVEIVTRDAGESVLRVRVATRSPEAAATVLERWLRLRATELIGARVAELAPIVGVSPARVTIGRARQRWGSASRGALSFTWRLMLVPPDVLDYVVVHELAHLRHAGHGSRFWSLVERHAPNHASARRWLREHHAEIVAALD